MITRKATVHEVIERSLPGGSVSRSVLVSLDEGAATTLRLTADEHEALKVALGSGKRFVVSLQLAQEPA